MTHTAEEIRAARLTFAAEWIQMTDAQRRAKIVALTTHTADTIAPILAKRNPGVTLAEVIDEAASIVAEAIADSVRAAAEVG